MWNDRFTFTHLDVLHTKLAMKWISAEFGWINKITTTLDVTTTDHKTGRWILHWNALEVRTALLLLIKQTRETDLSWLVTINQHTRLMALCPGLPRWAGDRKVKAIWILLEQETVSASGISWATCKSASRSRQITTPVAHHSVFYRSDALPVWSGWNLARKCTFTVCFSV